MSAFLILNAPIIISKFQIEKKPTITGKGKICIYFKTNQPPAEGLFFWPFDLAWNKAFSALLLNQNGQFQKTQW